MNSKARAPQTREEWEKRQNYIRKVLDPESGRYRFGSFQFNVVVVCF